MAFYLVHTDSQRYVREGISIGRMQTAAGHEFGAAVTGVALIRLSTLEACARDGIRLSRGAESALAQLRAKRRARAAAAKRRRAEKAREEARAVASAEKKRLEAQQALERRRDADRLRRAEKRDTAGAAQLSPAAVLTQQAEDDDEDLAPWD